MCHIHLCRSHIMLSPQPSRSSILTPSTTLFFLASPASPTPSLSPIPIAHPRHPHQNPLTQLHRQFKPGINATAPKLNLSQPLEASLKRTPVHDEPFQPELNKG